MTAKFRRTLQADRLGVPCPATAASMPASSWVRLSDGVEAFHEIRAVLRADGLGRIARLASAEPLVRPAAPGPLDVVDPDGETVDFPRLLAELLVACAATA